jgi:general secretion pathway protein G
MAEDGRTINRGAGRSGMKKDHDERRCRDRSGFTLIEVLLVVAILGILAGVVVVNFAGKGEKARIAAARTTIAAVCTALDAYEVDTGKFPSALTALRDNDGSPNWSGPYVKSDPVDPWGTVLNYTVGENSYKVISAGPDKSFGTADDLTSF